MEENVPNPVEEVEIGKHFSNAVITWKIRNLSLALCPPSKLIHGPEITLDRPYPTRWRMSLDISAEEGKISMYLTMLPVENAPNEKVNVNWLAYVFDHTGESSMVVERVHNFEHNCKLKMETFQLWSIVKDVLKKSSPDILKIKCCLLVQFGLKPAFPLSSIYGVRVLSNDLSRLCGQNMYSDLLVHASTAIFHLHQAMLCTRSSELLQLVQSRNNDNRVAFYVSDVAALDALFSYLYTGDLRRIFSQPTIMISDYIDRLGIPELCDAFPLQKMQIESKMEANDYSFRWTIADFKNIEDPIISTELYKEGMESRWQLHLYPKGRIGANEAQENNLYIEASLVNSPRPLDVNIEFACVNENGETAHSRRLFGRMNVGNKLGLEFFTDEDCDIEQCLIGTAFHLRFTVRIATGEVVRSIRETVPPSDRTMSNEQAFMFLSSSMSRLLVMKDCSDVTLVVDGEQFYAHRFVLAVRSPVLKELLDNAPKESSPVTLTLPNIRKHTFRIFIEYLYTGILADFEGALMELYDISCSFKVHSLKDICTENLMNSIGLENVLNLLGWCDNRRESLIAGRCMELISILSVGVKDLPDWPIFEMLHPELAAKILDSLGNNSDMNVIPEDSVRDTSERIS